VLWFTGLVRCGQIDDCQSGREEAAFGWGQHTYLLDGDNVRHGLNRDLGFTDADRVENIRRVGRSGQSLMVDAGLIVLVSFISPFRAERRMARNLVPDGEFVEIYIDTPLSVAEERDRRASTRRPAWGVEELHRNRLTLRGAGKS
jgi:bifunctional enzyme CysN/CysC